jgi:phosphonatase-like hydrolase
MIKLAVFDLAGTTVHDDNAVTTCLVEALAAAGVIAAFEDANALMGVPKPLAIRQLAPMLSEPAADAAHADFQRRMIHYYETSEDVREVTGTREAMATLKSAGVLVTVDTGFDRRTTDVLLARMPWDGVLDASITSDEVPNGRPHPDMIVALMDRFGVRDPSEVAKIGDTPSDLKQGMAAGCRFVIGVTSGTHSEEQLRQHPHTHLVDSVRDVPALILG